MSSLPPSAFWAKLSDDRSDWHPLVAHSADVAAVMERLLWDDSVLVPRLTALAEVDEWPESLGRLLVLLAFLHDLGKANHGFQERRHASFPERRVPGEGHVRIVFESLHDRSLREAIESPFSWAPPGDAEALLDLLGCAIAHHGRPHDVERLAAARRSVSALWAEDLRVGRSPLDEIGRLGRLGLEHAGLPADTAPDPIVCPPRFSHLVAGMVTLADWIGSTEEFFPFAPWAESEPEAYAEKARARAGRACRTIGVVAARRVVTAPAGEIYGRIFPEVFTAESGNTPTPLQEAVVHGALPSPGTRLIVESETGSGKTEAALALYARLREAGRVGGLMFALPTRATAKAMQGRVSEAIAHLYPEDPPPVVLAVGGLVPQAGSLELQGVDDLRMYPDKQDRQNVSWASSHVKRFLAGEVVVGTVDQAILAALAVRHANLRLAALSRHLLVIDEVHSYDRYMLESLRTLMDFQSRSGGVMLLMSATLSASARALLGGMGNEPALAEAVARPYPTVSRLRDEADWEDEGIASRALEKEVRWGLRAEDEALKQAVRGARAGARVCVLRNTIRCAQAATARLEAMAGPGLLWAPPGHESRPTYHARYTPADREVLDRAVLESFGSRGTKHHQRGGETEGVILVSTQVVEQSLDVDFDLLITDLCPVDVLLQRIGRLHRHRTRDGLRPNGYQVATAVVIAPPEGFGPGSPQRGPHGWGTVYRNLAALELTRRVIAERSLIRIPADNRMLIEEVYHPSREQQLEREGWTDALDENLGRTWAQVSLAADAVLDFARSYSENASRYQEEKRVRTRIGDDTVRVSLDPPVTCWYARGERAAHVDLRAEALARAGIDLRDPVLRGGIRAEDGSTHYPLGERSLRYGPQGWVIAQ
jgi:CRISPR-associated endonuclease/helicase Cas3